jgi:hypothetical protein
MVDSERFIGRTISHYRIIDKLGDGGTVRAARPGNVDVRTTPNNTSKADRSC